MTRTFSSEAENLLNLAKSSPKFALSHNKDAWLDLFSTHGSVSDPVGTPIHDSPEKLSLFYDTFIKPNKIVFKEFNDWVDVDRRKVYREIDIHITFPNGGIQVQPVHLKYLFDNEGKVVELRAFWNFLNGYPGNSVAKYSIGATKAFAGIFQNMGFKFGMTYLKALGAGSFSYGKYLMKEFAMHVTYNENSRLLSLFESPTSEVQLPSYISTTNVKAKDLLATLEEAKVENIYVVNHYNSGYFTSAKLLITIDKEVVDGLAIFELNKNGSKIQFAEIVW